jgi:hypothetical protein
MMHASPTSRGGDGSVAAPRGNAIGTSLSARATGLRVTLTIQQRRSTRGGLMRISTKGLRRAIPFVAAVTAVATVGCTNGGGGVPGFPTPPGPISSPYVVPCPGGMPGMDHGGGGMDHSGGGGGGGMGHMDMPARLNHPPCDAEKAAARKLVTDTRAAVKRQGRDTLAGLIAQGFFSIGDAVTGYNHYTRVDLRTDQYNLDPEHVEEFAVKNGRVVAAMYVLSPGMTMDNVPDIAGEWTMWHSHVLSWRGNNPKTKAYYQLFGAYSRQEPPMIHTWLVPNDCGPFAGTTIFGVSGGMEGACLSVADQVANGIR